MRRLRGSTSQRRFIFIADTSSTTGAGLANLTHSSSGLVAYYIAGDLNNEVQITLVAGTLGTYVSGGFVAVDNTNMPGWYEIGIPDAALDGGNQVAIQYRGATNMAPVNIYIELDAVDYQTDAFGALKPTTAGRTIDVTATGAAGIDWGNVENQGAVVLLTNTLIDQAGSVSGPVGEISGVTFPNHFDNLVISANGHVTATVDAINNNAITASSIQANALTSAKFAADSITATALATDAVNEIANAVEQLTTIADLATMIINDGTANARYSVSALQNGPSGAGGSTINVYPVSASTPERVAGTTITYYRNENRAVSVVTDFVLDALTLEFVVEDSEGTDLLVIADGSISKSNKTFTVTIGTTVTATISNYRWSLRDLTGGSNSVIARGVLSVQEAASNG